MVFRKKTYDNGLMSIDTSQSTEINTKLNVDYCLYHNGVILENPS